MGLSRDRLLFMVVSLSLLALATHSAGTLFAERTGVLASKVQDSKDDLITQDASLAQNILGDTVESTSPNTNGDSTTHRHAVDRTLESTFVVESYFDVAAFAEASKVGDSFDLLNKELRNSSSPAALEASARYREHFISRKKVSNGSVVLESLECGVSICAAEFRAVDVDLLNEYSKDVLLDSGFDAGMIFQPYIEDGDLPDRYRRYIFSHDLNVKEVRFADGSGFYFVDSGVLHRATQN